MESDTEAPDQPLEESLGFVFEDPVTYTIMEDAVITPCGHSFSASTIEDWSKDDEETSCPVCNTVFRKDAVIPNFKLREAIDRYNKEREEHQKTREEEQRRIEEERRQLEEERRLREEERRLREEEKRQREALGAKAKREEMERKRIEDEKARLEAEKKRIEDENRRIQAEVARLQQQQERSQYEIEQMRRRELEVQAEQDKKRAKEREQIKKLEEATMKRSVEEQQRLREMEERSRQREEEEKQRLKQMERERLELERNLRREKAEMEELRRKCAQLEQESRKTQEQIWSLWDYIPSVPTIPTGWGISWLWGSSAPTGKLVDKFSNYKIDCRRGSHRNCPVWKAIEKKNGDAVALKKLPPDTTGNNLVFREAMLHHYISHPHILKLKAITRDETKKDVYMVLPFVEYDLDHAINAFNSPFNTAQLRHLMHQLLLTVCYLHSANVVHRDIQPTSIMISHSGNGRIWLTSLGKARNLLNKPYDMLPASSYLGYRAPEIILTAPHLQSKLLTEEDWKAADVWSCGCIFAQLLFKRPLFTGTITDHQDKILKSVLSYAECRDTLGDMPSRFTLLNTHPAVAADPTASLRRMFMFEDDGKNLRRKSQKGKQKEDQEQPDENAGAVAQMNEEDKEEAFDLLKRMLNFDPQNRISAYDALNHTFFEEYEAERDKRRKLWQCPDDVLGLLRDENVPKFMATECAGL